MGKQCPEVILGYSETFKPHLTFVRRTQWSIRASRLPLQRIRSLAIGLASSVVSTEARGQSAFPHPTPGPPPHLWQHRICQKSRKREKNQEKEGEKNREGSFTLPLLTDTAGYATGLGFAPDRHPVVFLSFFPQFASKLF